MRLALSATATAAACCYIARGLVAGGVDGTEWMGRDGMGRDGSLTFAALLGGFEGRAIPPLDHL